MKKSLLQIACEEELLKREFARRAGLNGAPASGPATDLLGEARARLRTQVLALKDEVSRALTRVPNGSSALQHQSNH